MVERTDRSRGDQRPIGYYVHHHGRGHASRFENIAAAATARLVPLSESELEGSGADELVRLPSDVPERIDDPTAGGALHWAPVGSHVSADRARRVLEWVCDARPLGMVVDVSVEMALLCRLAGLPTVVVRQHGERTDVAHLMAYRSARRLLAPFPRALEHPHTPEWIVERTTYAGFIASAGPSCVDSGDRPTCGAGGERPSPDDIVVVWGSGGGSLDRSAILDIVAARPRSTVWLLGEFVDAPVHERVRSTGFVRHVDRYLLHQPAVIASAGNNAVADAARHGCALVVAPQRRPFDEQIRHAEVLDHACVAALAPAVSDVSGWANALEAAADRRPALTALGVHDGAIDAARAIEAAFDSSEAVDPEEGRGPHLTLEGAADAEVVRRVTAR